MSDSLDELQQTLATALFTHCDKAWLLFDTMHGDVADCLLEVKAEDIYTIPLHREDIPEAREPKLVSIHSHQVERIQQSLAFAIKEQRKSSSEEKAGFAIGGWLTSQATPKQLTRHLSRCMSQRIPQEGRKYFRWADRRVLEWMWPVMADEQKDQLLGPVESWWAFNRKAQLCHLQSKQVNEMKTMPTQVAWTITTKQLHHAGNCKMAQILIRGLQKSGTLPLDYVRQVKQVIDKVHHLKLELHEDNLLIASLILQVHSELTQHPRISAAIKRAREHKQPLSQLLASVPDPDGWHTIRQELTQRTRSLAS